MISRIVGEVKPKRRRDISASWGPARPWRYKPVETGSSFSIIGDNHRTLGTVETGQRGLRGISVHLSRFRAVVGFLETGRMRIERQFLPRNARSTRFHPRRNRHKWH